MFTRKITATEALETAREGETVSEYHDDLPFPSFLIFKRVNGRPLHVVLAVDSEKQFCIFVTLYQPSLDFWMEDFITRRK